MTASNNAYALLIDGRQTDGAGTFNVVNPANRQIVAQAPAASHEQLDAAVAAARRAQPGWAARPMDDRQAAIRSIGEIILAHLDELTPLLTSEHGKPLADAERELRHAAHWCETYAGFTLPETVTIDEPDRHCVTRRVPIGVVGAIAPWNFPITLAIWKVVPALLAGNTVVLKPSPFTPLTTLRLGALLQQALPPGVLNVVSGTDELGPWMTAHADIDKIAFTGSTQTGRRIMAGAADTLKRITLELGGNDAAVVLPDVDVETVAERLFWAAFANSAQICIAVKRLYIHEDIYDQLAAALQRYARTVRIGDGTVPGTQMGPIQNHLQFERVRTMIADARAEGLSFLTGDEPVAPNGYFIAPTLIDNPPEDSAVVQEEAFGPLLPLLKFSDIDDVVRRVNDTIYGLAGSVWSNDIDLAMSVGARLQCGTVWINETRFLSPFNAFGGHKQSGLGVENGIEGLLEYTNVQTMVVKKA